MQAAWGADECERRKVKVFAILKDWEVVRHVFIEGNHKVTSPIQLCSVVQQLKQLHAAGLVHGDVREANIVFCESLNVGYLIDFEFCRRAGDRNAVYCRYFNKDLPGRHRNAVPGHSMSAEHDVFSMISICRKWYKIPEECNDLDAVLACLQTLARQTSQ
jgi:serine/threonine protein kinase